MTKNAVPDLDNLSAKGLVLSELTSSPTSFVHFTFTESTQFMSQGISSLLN